MHQDTYPFIDPKNAPSSHYGHSVLITGASKGIGRSITLSFARSGASKIAIGARSSLDSLEAEILEAASQAGQPPPLVLKLELDIVDKKMVKCAADQVAQAFGSLDILVNNAGYLEVFTPMKEIDVDEWWRTWEVNVKYSDISVIAVMYIALMPMLRRGTFLVTHDFLPLVLKSHQKTIITITSVGAHGLEPGVNPEHLLGNGDYVH